MNEYVIALRVPTEAVVILPEQRELILSKWDAWFNELTSKGRLTPSKRLGADGVVLRSEGIRTDGPFVEMKEQLIGFVAVLAHSMEDACELTKGCPVFNAGGSVEIREVILQRS